MKSTITSRGQTVIPSEIRQHFHLLPSDRLEWIVEGSSIRVVPVKSDPIEAFRGQGLGGSVARLLSERNTDRNRE
ncbi:MAG: AbrB family transcriptional regulator [Methylobacter sp.]|nr:MAG: AbrB family transcriptional regulator [Methylobacter sp.]